VVDGLPAFWNLTAADRKRCRFPVDDHPTEFGHAVLVCALDPYVGNDSEPWKARSREERQTDHA
jgi:hypothetical protein